MTYTFTDYYYYEDGSHSDDRILQSFSQTLEDVVYYLKPFQFIFACIGLIFNIGHLIVVTRKSLRSNSVYVIMAGISICDLYTMLSVIFLLVDDYIIFYDGYDCYIPPGYFRTLLYFFIEIIREILRRLSTWLALLMALIRLLIIKYPLNSRFNSLSQPSFALKMIIFVLSLSSIIAFLKFVQYEIKDDGNYEIQFCKYLPKNYTVHTYLMQPRDFVDDFKPLALKYSLFSDGISKIIPVIALPFLSFFLIRCMQAASKSRRNLMNSNKDQETEKSIKMVALMTVFSMFAEGPIGVVYAIQTFFYDYENISKSRESLDDILINLVILNAVIHCIICYTVSSLYRNITLKLFWCKRNRIGVMPNRDIPLFSTGPRITASNAVAN